MQELTSRVHGSAIESILLRADHTRVANASEVDSKLAVVIGTKLLIEDLRHTIHSGGLKDGVGRGLVLLELVATEDGNG